MVTFDIISAWLVWIFPLVACMFVPLIAKKGDKIRNYFVIAVAAVTAAFAFSLVPGIFFGNGQPTESTIPWIAGISAGVYIDPLSRIVHVPCWLLWINHRHIFLGLHERRRRINTILLPHSAFHRFNDRTRNLR